MASKIYVLGGGITGLAAGYILDVPIITYNVGGQLMWKFPLGPRYIHSRRETKEFVKRLGLSTAERRIKIGYFYNNSYHESIPSNLINEYNLKTRGTVNTISSIGKTSFIALKVSFSDVIDRLKKRVKIIHDKILRISGNKMIGIKDKYQFKKIISTIPLPELYALYGIHRTFNYRPIGYDFSSFNQSFFFAETFKDYDYVYFPEMKYPYYRITKVSSGFVYEFSYNPFVEYPMGTIWQNIGKILPTSKIIPPAKNVILLGRFAEWNDDIMFHNVLQRILSLETLNEAVHAVQGVQL